MITLGAGVPPSESTRIRRRRHIRVLNNRYADLYMNNSALQHSTHAELSIERAAASDAYTAGGFTSGYAESKTGAGTPCPDEVV